MSAGRTNVISAVAELARQVRCQTLQLLEVPDPAWLTWAPPGTSNHILWHAGHAVWVQDVLTIEPITGRGELPPGWAEKFGMDSRPAAVDSWPAVAEVRLRLEMQLGRICELLSANERTIVANANEQSPKVGWPLLPGMIHGWNDEAKHQGEMHLLHKLCRAR